MKKIAIMYGGPSKESEVSIASAKNIIENIDKEKYDIFLIFITKDKVFKAFNYKNQNKKMFFSENSIFKFLKDKNIEIVFPVLHGEYGEDGKLQKRLEDNNIKFIGSGSVSSANAMDKNLANKIFEENGILIPKTKIISREKMKHDFAYPIFVKPISEGSSFELFKFENKDDYIAATDDIFKTYDDMLLQQCIVGREFTCGAIDMPSGSLSLPPTEIILNSGGIFDYKTKYKAGACSEVTPAVASADVLLKIKELALKCHKALGCADFSRTDMIMTSEGDFYVLEINTIPGMTKNSLLPAQLRAAGISIGDFANALLNR